MKTIYNYLNEYSESDFYGMHMPGHKRNEKMMENDLPYKIDITEIDGFDDLHHADGSFGRRRNVQRDYMVQMRHISCKWKYGWEF